MNERFRVTHWPGYTVEVPPVLVEHVALDHELLRRDRSISYEYRELPDEFYLREIHDVPINDIEAVAALVRTYGPLVRADRSDIWPPRAWEAIVRQSAMSGRHYKPQALERVQGVASHIDESIYRIRILRMLTLHAIAVREGAYVADIWGETSEDRAWQAFTGLVDAALSPFHVRVWIDNDDPDFNIGAPFPTAYEAGVLQLVNDMVQEVDFKTCPNCGRWFGRQRGRSVQGQTRSSGVTYCSPECGTYVRVKAYRARQRAKREAQNG